MSEERIPTHLWVSAVTRRSNRDGVSVLLCRRGEASRGSLLLKMNRLDGTLEVLVQQRGLNGRLGWMSALDGRPVTPDEAEAYIARALKRDPDLWVIEVEDREGVNPFVEGPEW